MAGIFGRAKPSAPAPMPDSDDAATRAAEERKRREIAGRSGRSSTILSQRGTPGTASYSNSLLGQSG